MHVMRRRKKLVVSRFEYVSLEAEAWKVCEEPLRDSAAIADLMDFLNERPQEEFWGLYLNAKYRLIGMSMVSQGTATGSLVHPREVFGHAVRLGACALVVVHHHPSGDPEPSAEDVQLTRRLIQAGELLGIPLLDHVIIGEGRHESLRTRIEF